MHKPSVAFGNLYQACLKHGIGLRLNTWDGGQRIDAWWMESGEQLFMWSNEWGQGDVTNVATSWLLEKNLITAADLEG